MKTHVAISIALLLLLFTNNSHAQTPVNDDSAAINEQFSRLQQALLARDTSSLGDFYATDAISLLENQPVRRGRDAIVLRWKKALVNPILIRWTSFELHIAASRQDAFQFGMFALHAADTTNGLLASGKVMFIWKKQIDRWRIALEMDNFNFPPSVKTPTQTKQ